METPRIDPKKLCGYSKFLWEKAFKEGYKIGLERAYKKRLERLRLTIYTNMKKENFGDSFIRFVLGISTRKFQKIQRLFNETIAGAERLLA